MLWWWCVEVFSYRIYCRVFALFFLVFFETYALSANLFLEVVESVGILFVECKGAAPESAVDVCGLVSKDDLSLCRQVYRGDTVFGLAAFLPHQVNLTVTWHVVE